MNPKSAKLLSSIVCRKKSSHNLSNCPHSPDFQPDELVFFEKKVDSHPEQNIVLIYTRQNVTHFMEAMSNGFFYAIFQICQWTDRCLAIKTPQLIPIFLDDFDKPLLKKSST